MCLMRCPPTIPLKAREKGKERKRRTGVGGFFFDCWLGGLICFLFPGSGFMYIRYGCTVQYVLSHEMYI